MKLLFKNLKVQKIALGTIATATTLIPLTSNVPSAQAHCTAYHPHHCVRDIKPPDIRPNPQNWFKVRVTICNSTRSPVFYSLGGESHRVASGKCWTHSISKDAKHVKLVYDGSYKRGYQRLVRFTRHRGRYSFHSKGRYIYLRQR